MIRFNGQTQQVMGDNTDPRLEQIIRHHPRFPLAFWSFCKRGDGVDAFASLSAETVGLHDSTFESIENDDERSYLHVYDNAYVNKLDMREGELHVMHGGYVGNLAVSGDSIIHISGHIGHLDIKESAQVFLYETAYVDWLHIYGEHAFVRIYKGAKVYAYDAPDLNSCAMIEDRASINKVLAGENKLAPFSQAPEKDVLLKIKMRFANHSELVDFCKEATKEYKKTNRLTFGAVWIAMLHHCCSYDSCSKEEADVDTVEFCADLCSDKADKMITSIRKHLLEHYPSLAGNMTIWWRGKHELDVIQIAVRHRNDDIKEAIEKATPEQWKRLINDVSGDDSVEYSKLTGLVRTDGSIDMDKVEASLKTLADDTKAEGAPHRTHEDDDRGIFRPCCQADD